MFNIGISFLENNKNDKEKNSELNNFYKTNEKFYGGKYSSAKPFSVPTSALNNNQIKILSENIGKLPEEKDVIKLPQEATTIVYEDSDLIKTSQYGKKNRHFVTTTNAALQQTLIPSNEFTKKINTTSTNNNLLLNSKYFPENINKIIVETKKNTATSTYPPTNAEFEPDEFTEEETHVSELPTQRQEFNLLPRSSPLSWFGNTQNANWRNFLRGRGGIKDNSYNLYNRISPDTSSRCSLQCPPCRRVMQQRRLRRKTAEKHSAELAVRLGTCNTRRDRMVGIFRFSHYNCFLN